MMPPRVIYPHHLNGGCLCRPPPNFIVPRPNQQEGKLEKELADQMASHVLHGAPAETPPSHHPLVLAKTLEGTTPLMAAAGCPSPCCVEAVSDVCFTSHVIGYACVYRVHSAERTPTSEPIAGHMQKSLAGRSGSFHCTPLMYFDVVYRCGVRFWLEVLRTVSFSPVSAYSLGVRRARHGVCVYLCVTCGHAVLWTQECHGSISR